MVIIKDFDAPCNCVNCQNEGLSEIVGCGLFDEWGKHPDCPFIEVKEGACMVLQEENKQLKEKLEKIEQIVNEEMQIMESDLLWKIKEVLEKE